MFEPVGDKIIVKSLAANEQTKMQTKPGDIVVYPKLGAKKIDYKGDEYLVLKENDILTILTEENNNE